MAKKNFMPSLNQTARSSDSFVKNNIKIDDSFRQLIPNMSEEQRQQLENNILQEGIREPLIIWKEQNILIDGHNRYEIAQKHQISFEVHTLSFNSPSEVYTWMINNQLGRRNLTNEQASYLRGLRYEKEKTQGKRVDLTSHQNDEKLGTAEKIAKEYQVGKATIERDAQFAKGIDLIGKENPELKKEILSGKVKINKNQIQALAKLESFPKIESLDQIAEILQADKPAKKQVKTDLEIVKVKITKILKEINLSAEEKQNLKEFLEKESLL
jgi:hypothetical protein